jgi:hypothetical protein
MAQIARNVKGKVQDTWDHAQVWFECHPKTLAYISFFLALNYILDFLPSLF